MSSYFEDVSEFHVKILRQEQPPPQLVDGMNLLNRVRFLEEEIMELQTAHQMEDLVGVADALADLVYVALGTAYQMGIPFDAVWAAVHKANMTKARGITKRGMAVDAVKPIDWVGPEAEITEALYRASKS